jgi:CRP-like cAMP-binding protein
MDELATLKPFDYFGERAMQTGAKRAATIAAVGRCTLLVMTRDKFEELFGKQKLNVKFAKRTAVRYRS